MNRELLITNDGSPTILNKVYNTTYHSIHGALQESMHVFIEAGLQYYLEKNPSKNSVDIFEMGFGTGLNALLTLHQTKSLSKKIFYESIELFPLQKEEYEQLDFSGIIDDENSQKNFSRMHECVWEKDIQLNENFSLHKTNQSMLNFFVEKKFDIIYYDAFASSAQPELWTKEVFEKLFSMMNANGVFTTYSSKGDVRRSLLAAGFSVSKLKGPKDKREMLRAEKI